MVYRCIICRKFDVLEQIKSKTSNEEIGICDSCLDKFGLKLKPPK